ncbi:hypothetical protein Psi01_18560 [Planobispora siamensis]|uniref:Uncharacterized protein n=1 Tax=Planobispora siamensis TaxID=936338 RepID=A0A8J3SAL4_9ACTN|nr:hypothetical protein Psi01_18560 [Planobispora siamensis]
MPDLCLKLQEIGRKFRRRVWGRGYGAAAVPPCGKGQEMTGAGGVPVPFQEPMKPKVVEPPAGTEPFQAALEKV